MDKIQSYRKVGAPSDTKTQNVMELAKPTHNIYATTVAIAQRADQISEELKHELLPTQQTITPKKRSSATRNK